MEDAEIFRVSGFLGETNFIGETFFKSLNSEDFCFPIDISLPAFKNFSKAKKECTPLTKCNKNNQSADCLRFALFFLLECAFKLDDYMRLFGCCWSGCLFFLPLHMNFFSWEGKNSSFRRALVFSPFWRHWKYSWVSENIFVLKAKKLRKWAGVVRAVRRHIVSSVFSHLLYIFAVPCSRFWSDWINWEAVGREFI